MADPLAGFSLDLGTATVVGRNPQVAFFGVGGFLYFDKHKHLVGCNALTSVDDADSVRRGRALSNPSSECSSAQSGQSTRAGLHFAASERLAVGLEEEETLLSRA